MSKKNLKRFQENARRAACARKMNLQLFAEPALSAAKKFWAFEGDELRLDGVIAEESWWGDEVTPAAFRAELSKHPGDIRVFINSPGGDVIAGSLIYTALKEHKGKVTVAIDGLAASAASVIAMAGDVVQIAPTAYIMIHNAWSFAIGDAEEMRKYADWLDEVDAGIRMAYKLKTGLDDAKLDELMQADTWMNAESAQAYGFVDEILYTQKATEGAEPGAGGSPSKAAANAANGLGQALAAGLEPKRPGVTWSLSKQIAALKAQVKAGAPAAPPTAQTMEPAAPTPPVTTPAAPAEPNDDERKLAAARLALLSEMA